MIYRNRKYLLSSLSVCILIFSEVILLFLFLFFSCQVKGDAWLMGATFLKKSMYDYEKFDVARVQVFRSMTCLFISDFESRITNLKPSGLS